LQVGNFFSSQFENPEIYNLQFPINFARPSIWVTLPANTLTISQNRSNYLEHQRNHRGGLNLTAKRFTYTIGVNYSDMGNDQTVRDPNVVFCVERILGRKGAQI